MPAILTGLFAPDQRSEAVHRLLAALGLAAAASALSVVADEAIVVLFALAAVLLIGAAQGADDRRRLRRFVVVNGVAMLLLAWAATERADLLVERSPEQIDVLLNGVRLSAPLDGAPPAGAAATRQRVAVGLSPLSERPVAAPWVYASLPWLEPVGDWLGGGLRGGLTSLRLIDGAGTELTPPIERLWQPSRPGESPLLGGSAPDWESGRAADGTIVLTSPALDASSYRVEAVLARPSGAVRLTLAADDGGPALDVLVAPDRRHLEVLVRAADGSVETLVGGPFVFRRSVVGWVQAILREVGRSWLVALMLVGAARLLALPERAAPVVPAGRQPPAVAVAVAASAIGCAVLAFAGLIGLLILDGIPHTVESIAYLFQAQVMAAGGLWAPAPVLPEFFQQAYIAATADGRWFGVLPPGQSLLVAAGLAAGAPWVVGPLAAGLAVAATVVFGCLTAGPTVGAVAGLLLLCSPFVLLLSGDMLAHPAALLLTMLMLAGVAAGARAGRPGASGWALAGLALGGLVLTRPLAAAGVGVPLTLVLVFGARGLPLGALLPRAAVFLVAAAPGVLYAAAVNQALTGSPFVPPLSLWSPVDRLGFGPSVGTRGGHDLTTALGNTWANLAVLQRHLFGWPAPLTLAFACVPFVVGRWARWDRLALVVVLGLVGAHWFYWSDGIVYGPRFLFEATGALALLTARGAALLARAGRPKSGEISAERGPAAPPPPDAATALPGLPFVVTLVAVLFAVGLVGYLPETLLAYRDYNGVSRANLAVVEAAGLQDAVVFVTSEWPDWQSYGSVFPANGPFLDRPIVFARDLGQDENWRLLARYAERRGLILRDGQLVETRP